MGASLIPWKYDCCFSVHCNARCVLLVCRLHGERLGLPVHTRHPVLCTWQLHSQHVCKGSHEAWTVVWDKDKSNGVVQLIIQNYFEVTSALGMFQRGLVGDKHMRAGRGHLLEGFECHTEKCVYALMSFLSRTITWCILYFKKIYLSQSIAFIILSNILDHDICFQPTLPVFYRLFQALRLLQVSIWSHL